MMAALAALNTMMEKILAYRPDSKKIKPKKAKIKSRGSKPATKEKE